MIAGTELDELMTEYVRHKEEIARLGKELAVIEKTLDDLAGPMDVTHGVLELEGEKLKARITRRINVKYSDKQRLSQLIEEHKAVLLPMFRFEVKESGSKVEQFLVTGNNQSLMNEIAKIRIESQGKPSIEITASGR